MTDLKKIVSKISPEGEKFNAGAHQCFTYEQFE